MARQLTVATTGNGPYYAPFVLAEVLGYFGKHDLEVIPLDNGYGDSSAADTLSGAADVGMGGWWRPMAHCLAGDPLIAFAQVNQRNATYLLGRTPNFDWPDLEGRGLIVFNSAPSPWLAMSDVLRRHGVAMDRIRLLPGFSPRDAMNVFTLGCGDYIELPEPLAGELVESGAAHVVRSMVRETGPIPWTILYARPETLEAKREQLSALTEAITDAQQFIADASLDELVDALRGRFPMAEDRLRALVDDYRSSGTWPSGPVLSLDQFRSWAAALHEGGWLRRIPDFAEVGTHALTGPEK